MNWYTADWHFGCHDVFNRTKARAGRFQSVEDMGKTIIRNLNEKVAKDDVLFIIGDVACKDYDPVNELKQIECRNKILIQGNHDSEIVKHRHLQKLFVDIRRTEIFKDKEVGESVVLNHFPLADWNCKTRGVWHFYGHVHDGLGPDGEMTDAVKFMNTQARCYNVCVDVNDFSPVRFQDVLELTGK